jgi:hypothetical protein
MGDFLRSTVLFFTVWLSLLRELFNLFVNTLRILIEIPASAGAALISVVSSGYSAINSSFASPAYSVYISFVDDIVANGAWLYVRFCLPLLPTITNLVGINLATVVRLVIRGLGRVFAVFMIVGTVLGPLSWMAAQSDVQLAFDEVHCRSVPTLAYGFDTLNAVIDFIEPINSVLNVFLDIIYDYLDVIFDELVVLLFQGVEILLLFISGDGVTACDPGNNSREYCSDDCVIRRLWCWFISIYEFVLIRVFGGILSVFLPAPIKNIIINWIQVTIAALGFGADAVAAVFRGENIPGIPSTNCNPSVPLSTISTPQGSFDVFTGRVFCILPRYIAWITFYYQTLFSTGAIFLDYFIETINVFFTAILGPEFGGAVRVFLGILSKIVEILKDLPGYILKKIKEYVDGPIDAIKSAAAALSSLVNSIIGDPLGTIQDLGGKLLSGNVLGDKLEDVFSGLSDLKDIVDNLPGIGGIAGGVAGAISGAFSDCCSWRRRRLLTFDTEPATAIIPVTMSEEQITAVRRAVGASFADSSSTTIRTLIGLAEIENKTIHSGSECGFCDVCTKILMSTNTSTVPPYSLEVAETGSDGGFWMCAMRYLLTRRICGTYANYTTYPQYHIRTLNTWLPETDFCKSVLEKDIVLYRMHYNETDASDGDAFYYDNYIPCVYLYRLSFMWTQFNETTQQYHMPTEFVTQYLATPSLRFLISTAVRLMSAPHKDLPVSTNDSNAYSATGFLHNAGRVLYNHVIDSSETVDDEPADAPDEETKTADAAAAAAKRAINNARLHRLSVQLLTEVPISLKGRNHFRLHPSKGYRHGAEKEAMDISAFPLRARSMDAVYKAIDPEMHFHYTTGFTRNKNATLAPRRTATATVLGWFTIGRTAERKRVEIQHHVRVNRRRAAWRAVIAANAEHAGGHPIAQNAHAAFDRHQLRASATEMETRAAAAAAAVEDPLLKTNTYAAADAAAEARHVVRRARRRRNSMVRFAERTKRHLQQASGARDSNFSDFLRASASTVLAVIISVLKVLAAIVEEFAPPLAEIVLDVADRVAGWNLEESASDFLDTVDVITDYVGITYFTDLFEDFTCTFPNAFDARSNPNGEWRVPCVLKLRLIPEFPRFPENYENSIIDWGSPCRGPLLTCNALFSGSLPCEDGYRDCNELGLIDGFSVLFYKLEKADTIGIMAFLRSDAVGTLSVTAVRVLVTPFAPVFYTFGFGNIVTEAYAFDSLRDIPYVGSIVFQFESGIPRSEFHDFCVRWKAPSLVLPLLIVVIVGYITVLFIVRLLNTLFKEFTICRSLIYLPTGLIGEIQNAFLRHDYGEPVFVVAESWETAPAQVQGPPPSAPLAPITAMARTSVKHRPGPEDALRNRGGGGGWVRVLNTLPMPPYPQPSLHGHKFD